MVDFSNLMEIEAWKKFSVCCVLCVVNVAQLKYHIHMGKNKGKKWMKE